MNLSLLCVTKAESYTPYFLGHLEGAARALGAECVLVADGHEALGRLEAISASVRESPTRVVQSRGFLESVLDEAVTMCGRDWVLRIDDDEVMSPAMLRWLAKDFPNGYPVWKFPRANLFGAPNQYITNAPLWPDHQTRLTTKLLAGGRTTIHAGCPHGGGALAPGLIEHHKFLVKPLDARRAIAARYEQLQPGAGTPMLAFSAPEDVIAPLDLKLAELGEGWR
jgi:hypothetical protein